MELSDASYYMLNIQDLFEYTFIKDGEKNVSPSIRLYKNKIKSRITFK